ncbi:unnamed protein product [Rhizophagus irregularis]|nr:unnamed protein product [Rhizophagus irregularis]
MSFAVKFALLRRVPRYGLFILGSMRGILMFSRRGEGKPSKRSMVCLQVRKRLENVSFILFVGSECSERWVSLSVFDFGSGIGFSMLLLKRGNEMMVFGIRLREVRNRKGNVSKFPFSFCRNTGRLDDGVRNEPVPDVDDGNDRYVYINVSFLLFVPDVGMNETTGSGRLDNGNRNEPVFTSFYFGIGH